MEEQEQKQKPIIKIIKLEVAHCEVCPFVTETYHGYFKCHYPPNIAEHSTIAQNKLGKVILPSELPIPKWCKQENKDIKIKWK